MAEFRRPIAIEDFSGRKGFVMDFEGENNEVVVASPDFRDAKYLPKDEYFTTISNMPNAKLRVGDEIDKISLYHDTITMGEVELYDHISIYNKTILLMEGFVMGIQPDYFVLMQKNNNFTNVYRHTYDIETISVKRAKLVSIKIDFKTDADKYNEARHKAELQKCADELQDIDGGQIKDLKVHWHTIGSSFSKLEFTLVNPDGTKRFVEFQAGQDEDFGWNISERKD